MRAGAPDRARDELGRTERALPPSATKQCAVFLADLASVDLNAGDVDRACDVALDAAQALSLRPYATGTKRLRAFRAAAQPHASTRAVRNLDLALAEL